MTMMNIINKEILVGIWKPIESDILNKNALIGLHEFTDKKIIYTVDDKIVRLDYFVDGNTVTGINSGGTKISFEIEELSSYLLVVRNDLGSRTKFARYPSELGSDSKVDRACPK